MLVQQKEDHNILTDAGHHNPASVSTVSEVHKLEPMAYTIRSSLTW